MVVLQEMRVGVMHKTVGLLEYDAEVSYNYSLVELYVYKAYRSTLKSPSKSLFSLSLLITFRTGLETFKSHVQNDSVVNKPQ